MTTPTPVPAHLAAWARRANDEQAKPLVEEQRVAIRRLLQTAKRAEAAAT